MSNLPCFALASLGMLGLSSAAVRAEPVMPPLPAPAALPAPVAAPAPPPVLAASATPRVVVPAVEPDGATLSGAGPSPFASKAAAVTPAAGQSLTAPVAINANISADALTVTQAGKGRAITGSLTNTSNTFSAIKGITAGSGGGVNGVNSGTLGPAGKFQITASGSAQPGIVSTTAGTGNAVQGVVTNTAEDNTPAVLGQHVSGPKSYGIGVEGDGNLIGVKGLSDSNYGVFGTSNGGTGVYGQSDGTGANGVFGQSSSGRGVHGFSTSGYGLFAQSSSGIGAYGLSNSSTGVYGASTSATGVDGRSDSGYGIVGQSGSSYAGVFYGPVYATGAMYAASYGYTSDRDQKQDLTAVDSSDLLTRIAAMPITSWDYKTKPAERHIGPMAQDFHAAFGLGTDDKHIDVVDGIGVSLAAIQALQQQAERREDRVATLETLARFKDAQIEALQARLDAMQQAVGARLAQLEQLAAVRPAEPTN